MQELKRRQDLVRLVIPTMFCTIQSLPCSNGEFCLRDVQVEHVSPAIQYQNDAARSQPGSLHAARVGTDGLRHTGCEGRSLADEVRAIMNEGMMQLKHEKEASQHAEQVRFCL